MKLHIVGVNSKYTHTNLAIRYLRDTVEDRYETILKEYSINDNLIAIERDILLGIGDVVAFSCYVWNAGMVKDLCDDIKKASPETVVIVGGPEVTYDAVDVLSENPGIDFVIEGEGEITFPSLIDYLAGKSELPKAGIAYRENGEITDLGMGLVPDMNKLPMPYLKEIDNLQNKILYYESSRGCPYSCKYCLSGDNCKVRFRDLEITKADLKFFDDKKIPLIKFVDRTFNANRKRAIEMWDFIGKLPGDTRFHMEITGELLNDETVEILKGVNPQKLQFEIGVQTTNEKTLHGINRACDQKRLFHYIKRLLDETDIHIHLDLIAGLPYEGMDSFIKSFNDVIALRPHVLQLGFLKVLKGSGMHSEAEDYGMVYRSKPPYEIISTKYISYRDILFLKDVDFVFDKVYNSESFSKTVDFLFEKYEDKFEIFAKLVDYFREHKLINTSFSKAKLYDYVYDCFREHGDEFEKCIRYDYILSLHPGKMPAWAKSDDNFRFSEPVYEFLKNEDLKKKVIPHRYDVPAKAIIKHARFEKFDNKVLMFDYEYDMVFDVSAYF